MPYSVYVLRSESTGQTYVGQTSDLHARVAEHNDSCCQLTRHTKRRLGPWEVLYSEQCPTRAVAIKREKQLKSGAGRRLIKSLLQESGC